MLSSLQRIVSEENIAHRIAWIELKPGGNLLLQSVPERIGLLLQDRLFSRKPVTLRIPQGSRRMLPEILPPGASATMDAASPTDALQLPLSFPASNALESFLEQPLTGKTIILVPGRRTIEDLYVKFAIRMEEAGATLVCQGLNGGLGRMQAEFLAAEGPTVWLLTPWMFEGVDLPASSVHHLVIHTMPFDHPNHAVLSRRSQFYPKAFEEYSLPRLLHRAFRLLRTYARSRTTTGDVMILDERLRTRSYGRIVMEYLNQFGTDIDAPIMTTSAPPPAAPSPRKSMTKTAKKPTKVAPGFTSKPVTKKKSANKKGDNQMAMF
jgi:hypothetical protein